MRTLGKLNAASLQVGDTIRCFGMYFPVESVSFNSAGTHITLVSGVNQFTYHHLTKITLFY